MKKTLAILLSLVLCFCLSACLKSDDPSKKQPKGTYGLNETAVLNDLKFTANEIKEFNGTRILKPDEGNVFVGIKFTVENISDRDQVISSLLLFDGYVDNIQCSYSLTASGAFLGETLDGSVAPGKKLVGWYALEIPKDWSTIELHVKSDWLSNNSLTFTFSRDIVPPIKEETYRLNETAAFNDLKFTATEIKEFNGSQIYFPKAGNVFVAIEFAIENISDRDQVISSLLLFEGYADDIKYNCSSKAVLSLNAKSLDGRVASGKKMIGWYGLEVPKDWSNIELHVQGDLLSGTPAIFVFTK